MAQPNCQLLELPAELRIKIYEYAFVIQTGKDARAASHPYYLDGPVTTSCLQLSHVKPPPLLRTSRQIRHEALPLFFQTTALALTRVNSRFRRPDRRTLAWLRTICDCDCVVALQYDGYMGVATVATLALRDGKLFLEDSGLVGSMREEVAPALTRARMQMGKLQDESTYMGQNPRPVTIADMVKVAGTFFEIRYGGVTSGFKGSKSYHLVNAAKSKQPMGWLAWWHSTLEACADSIFAR
ncbi:hypothetical protein LTR62_003591 [Meristemomyces frigidus]|uniref:Uncharacterized protein n=1 Tax=Meristemomyces frigidus TaxID=1508187 RepID=A0AAN7YPM0_9PEZI|nr:hypothetical protein LTR62_003591 [Meristemomyces frigidus]